MKVFISWSGELSKQIALRLKDWLPRVIQQLEEPFVSDDAEKGIVWTTGLMGELEESTFGIICLTPSNITNPWIVFETGALYKNQKETRVCPIIFKMKPANIPQPLGLFQFTQFNEEDMFRLIKSINSHLENASLNSELLRDSFDVRWLSFQKEILALLSNPHEEDEQPVRNQSEMLEEVLGLVRDLSHKQVNFELIRAISDPIIQDEISATKLKTLTEFYEELKRNEELEKLKKNRY